MRMNRWSLTIVALLAFVPISTSAALGPQGTPPMKPTATFRFEKYAVDYPKAYTPQPLFPGDPGGFFIQTSPFGFLFVVMSREGEDTVIPQGRALADALVDRLARANKVVSAESDTIPADRYPPKVTLGKSLDAVTEQGLKLHAEFYLTALEGRKVMVGFATLTGDNVKPELRHLLTPYPADVEQDFRQMLGTLRVN